MTIHSVSGWAALMGYKCEKYFARKVKAHHDKAPYALIIEKKVERIKKELETSPEKSLYHIASDLGFADDNAFYKFVKRHTGKTPGQLKWESKMGD
ncbi:MAG: helix-turn-helix domain-containing protein [Bacteroidota bacterium]